MTKPRDPETLLAAYLVEGMEVLPDRVADAVLDEVQRTHQRAGFGSWRTRSMSMIMTTLAAAAVVAVVGLVSAFFVIERGLPVFGGPDPSASSSPRASQPAVVVPSATPTARPTPTAPPSPTPTPIIWTQASLKEDWPAPVRTEPAGGARVEQECCLRADPVGDTGSDAYPWVDIREFGFCNPFCLGLKLVSNQPPVVHPTEQWIAYGVVVDDDGDGAPDRRIGMDNIAHATGELDHRVWTTDLHTGRTTVGWHRGSVIDSYYPPTSYRADAHFSFGGSVTGGGTMGSAPERFYIWASVIQGGQVVATDYAPDVGWLTLTSTPQAKSSPSPAPGPTPQVMDDPDVPGGRLWTTTVVNNSPDPATLFVAEDDGSNAMGRLVGTVTPSVVPPNTTMKVTFALPPAGSRGWAIFVNPGPNGGGLNWPDVPAYGEFRITADGNTVWRSLIE